MSDIIEGKTIAVIDDNGSVLDLERGILEYEGAVVKAFDRANVAYACINNGLFDAVVTDIVIGHVNGISYLQKRLNSGIWIPAVIVSGSQSSRQLRALFEQGYALSGNHIPLALVTKRPADFSYNLVTRLEGVVEAGKNFSNERIVESLRVVKNAAEAGGVYEECSRAIDEYFAFAASLSDEIGVIVGYVKPGNEKELKRRKDDLRSILDDAPGFSEFVGMPTLALHRMATKLAGIDALFEGLKVLLDDGGARIIDHYQSMLYELGGFYHIMRSDETIGKKRRRAEDDEVRFEQFSPSAWHSIAGEKEPVRRRTPFDSFPLAPVKPQYSVLYAHDMASSLRFRFKEFGQVDIAGVFYQAINALALNEGYDVLAVHASLKADKKKSPYDGSIERTVNESIYPENLIPEARAFFDNGIARVKQRYPSLSDLINGKIESAYGNFGELLAAIACEMKPSTVVLIETADESFYTDSIFKGQASSPYDIIKTDFITHDEFLLRYVEQVKALVQGGMRHKIVLEN